MSEVPERHKYTEPSRQTLIPVFLSEASAEASLAIISSTKEPCLGRIFWYKCFGKKDVTVFNSFPPQCKMGLSGTFFQLLAYNHNLNKISRIYPEGGSRKI